VSSTNLCTSQSALRSLASITAAVLYHSSHVII